MRILTVLPFLCLTACAGLSKTADLPVSDLDALQANVQRTTSPTLLPNGLDYCAELAKMQSEQDACTGDLEDALYRANQRGRLTQQTVDDFVRAEKLRRNPCGFWRRLFLPSECR